MHLAHLRDLSKSLSYKIHGALYYLLKTCNSAIFTIVSDREGSVLADVERAGGGVCWRPLKARQVLYDCILFLCQLRDCTYCVEIHLLKHRDGKFHIILYEMLILFLAARTYSNNPKRMRITVGV